MTTEIHIQGFNPLRLTLPKETTVTGTVYIYLPEHHYVVKELPFADLLNGAHIGSDAAMWRSELDLGENEVPLSDVVGWIHACADKFEELHMAIQRGLNEHGPLLR